MLRGRHVALADLDQGSGADLDRHDVLDLVATRSRPTTDDVEAGAVDQRDQCDRPEAGVRPAVSAGCGALVLADQQCRVPDPHVVDAHEPAPVAGARLGDERARAHDEVARRPRRHAESIAPETDLERVGDHRVEVAGGDRPLGLDLAHRLGDVVQSGVGHRPEPRHQLLRILHVPRMLGTVRNRTSVACDPHRSLAEPPGGNSP